MAYTVANGRVARADRTRRGKHAFAPVKKLKKHFLHWIPDGYRAGLVPGLLIFDTCAVGIIALDLLRFRLYGFELLAAGRLARDIILDWDILGLSAGTFLFLLAIAPFVVALISNVLSRSGRDQKHVQTDSSRSDKKSGRSKTSNSTRERRHDFYPGRHPRARRQWVVFKVHLFLAVLISVATIYAIAMQTLSGAENQASLYSFNSYWVGAVSKIHWLGSVVGVSAVLKYAARFLGHDPGTFEDTLTETSTELPLD